MRKLAAVIAATTLAVLSLTASPSSGASTPTCFGRVATVVGTSGPDTITPTTGKQDVVVSLGGADTINSTSGAAISPNEPGDLICSGSGADSISTGAGPDKVSAGDGNDSVSTHYGSDTISGGSGDDDLWADSYEDTDPKFPSNDVIHGGTGDDTLLGVMGAEKFYGDADNDKLWDSRNCTVKSSLYGGAGGDQIVSESCEYGAGTVADLISGDSEYDTAYVNCWDTVSTSTEEVYRYQSPNVGC